MTKWARVTVNIEQHLKKAAQQRAKSQRRSMAGYVASLIDRDTSQVEEEQAPYPPTLPIPRSKKIEI